MINPVAIRLLNQQLISPQFNNPTEIVSHLGAMQAQDYRMMRWAVAMRTRNHRKRLFVKLITVVKLSECICNAVPGN